MTAVHEKTQPRYQILSGIVVSLSAAFNRDDLIDDCLAEWLYFQFT